MDDPGDDAEGDGCRVAGWEFGIAGSRAGGLYGSGMGGWGWEGEGEGGVEVGEGAGGWGVSVCGWYRPG